MKKKYYALFLITILCAVLLFVFVYKGASDSIGSGNVTFGIIDVVSDESDLSEQQALADSMTDESMFQIFINTDITVDSDGVADLLVQNSIKNCYACYIELVDDGGNSIYKSDVIAPGYKLERDAVQNLDAGRHDCVAYFHVLDASGQEFNKIGVNVVINK